MKPVHVVDALLSNHRQIG